MKQLPKANTAWTPIEEGFVANTVKEYQAAGKMKADAFEAAAKQLGRTVDSVAQRWRKIEREKNKPLVLQEEPVLETVEEILPPVPEVPITTLTLEEKVDRILVLLESLNIRL